LKNTREQLDILNAYRELGSYRAAARLCRTSDKTVKRVVQRLEAGGPYERRPRHLESNTASVKGLIEEKVRSTDGLISAKRLLPVVRAAGYQGSARNLRRAVAEAKARWRRRRRLYRPWVPVPGQHLVIDWTPVQGGLQMFCAVLAWSRYRFVRFARDQGQETTLRLLAECLEELGGVPAVVLSDRMACLRAGIVANQVVPHPEYVRFAAHYGFRPDFCESGDPESKGVVEHLAGYGQRDLVAPEEGWDGDVGRANRAAGLWGLEVNGRVHSEIQAVPAERLQEERQVLRPLPSLRAVLRRAEQRKVDRLQTVRFGSARYSVPSAYVGHRVEVGAEDGVVVISEGQREVTRHPLVGPGEVSLLDEHYPTHARQPARPVRVRTATERSFLELGPLAEAFLRAAAAAGTARLASELSEIVALEASWGRSPLVAALERALRFRRFTADDVRAILDAGAGVSDPVAEGAPLEMGLPEVPVRPLSAYALEAIR
jgi:transposase